MHLKGLASICAKPYDYPGTQALYIYISPRSPRLIRHTQLLPQAYAYAESQTYLANHRIRDRAMV